MSSMFGDLTKALVEITEFRRVVMTLNSRVEDLTEELARNRDQNHQLTEIIGTLMRALNLGPGPSPPKGSTGTLPSSAHAVPSRGPEIPPPGGAK